MDIFLKSPLLSLFTVFLSIGLLVLLLLLYSLLRSVRPAKDEAQQHLQADLSRLARRHKVLLSETDLFCQKMIGLDHTGRKLLWVDHQQHRPRSWCLSLGDYTSCTLITTKHKDSTTIDQIFLELQPREHRPPVHLTFYRDTLDPPQEKQALLRKAFFWKEQIARCVQPEAVPS